MTLTLTDGDGTRTFFDDKAAAETWEKSLSSLAVYAFDKSGALLVHRDFTPSELTAKSATFSLPKSAAGTECSFYAVANLDVPAAPTKSSLTTLLEKEAANYNGTFAEVSAAAKRARGFVMSGSATKTVGAVNSTTSVAVTLKRTVAKIALQTTVDPAFAEKYPGTIRINSVKALACGVAVARLRRRAFGRRDVVHPYADARLGLGTLQFALLPVRDGQGSTRAAACCWRSAPPTIWTAATRRRTTVRR